MTTTLDGPMPDPERALALEDDMFRRQASACGVWSTTASLVVPRSFARHPRFEDAQAALAASGTPVVCRGSGGGVVPQGPGILNVSVTVPRGLSRHAVRADFAWLCAPLRALLASRGLPTTLASVPGSFCDGDYNVAVHGQKLAGTAQRRGKSHALLHMVLLAHPDLGRAVDAVRRFYTALGLRDGLRREAHTTLGTLLPDADPAALAEDLRERFRRGLALRLAPTRPGDIDGERDHSHSPHRERAGPQHGELRGAHG